MSEKHDAPDKHESSRRPRMEDALLSRRKLMGGAIAGLGALGSTARARKPKKAQSQMPVWSGDLSSSTKPQPRIPKSSKPNGLNMIVIIADTWRADHLGCYGNKTIHTPSLDALATKSVQFDRHYAHNFPTMPARADFYTGRWTSCFMS